MKELQHTVINQLGMHARPAGLFAKLAKEHHSRIKVFKGEQSADAVRILAVMSMEIKAGDRIRITVDGEDEEEVMRQVREVCEQIL